MSRSVGETVSSLIGRPGERVPSPDHLEAVRGGQEFVIGDVVITGSRHSSMRFLLSFRCEQVWGQLLVSFWCEPHSMWLSGGERAPGTAGAPWSATQPDPLLPDCSILLVGAILCTFTPPLHHFHSHSSCLQACL